MVRCTKATRQLFADLSHFLMIARRAILLNQSHITCHELPSRKSFHRADGQHKRQSHHRSYALIAHQQPHFRRCSASVRTALSRSATRSSSRSSIASRSLRRRAVHPSSGTSPATPALSAPQPPLQPHALFSARCCNCSSPAYSSPPASARVAATAAHRIATLRTHNRETVHTKPSYHTSSSAPTSKKTLKIGL